MTAPMPSRNDRLLPDFKPNPELYPFESRWFDGPIGRMHLIDEGPRDAPVIMMCHGAPTWSFLFSELIVRLRDRYRCVAADLYGMGLSERPRNGFDYTVESHGKALEQFVAHLDLRDFILMCQDWGGPTGLAMGVACSERISGVVLGNTWFWYMAPLKFKLWSGLAPTWLGRLLLRHTDAEIRVFFPSLINRKLTPVDSVNHLDRRIDSPDLLPGCACCLT